MAELLINVIIRETKDIEIDDIVELYMANKWSSANKPHELYSALLNSHSLVTAWDGSRLIGIGNALSDGFLVVYYPHLLVHPDYQSKGVGTKIMDALKEKYKDFHQQMLVSDQNALAFYQRCGFERAGKTEALWIYAGDEH